LTAEELSKTCKSDPEMTQRLVTACCALGLLQKKGKKYENSKVASKYLVRDSPTYQGHWIDHARDDLWKYWGKELEEEIGGRHKGEKNWNRRFIMAMHEMALGGEAQELADNLDLAGRKKLFDVGGGSGNYSIFLCKANPMLRAIVFDLPEAIEIAREVIKSSGMEGKVKVQAGSWDKVDFGSENDVVLLSNVLHGEGSKAEMKLKKAYDSLKSGGLLIIRDFVLNDSKTGPLGPALFNLMLGAYSIGEITDLVEEAGFEEIRELDIPHKSHSIITALKS
jgi:ubiquinone/menaquinone biosynthesis C-methylase UbiE